MKPCPVCGQPMPLLRKGQPRQFCSLPCRDTGWSAYQLARNAEMDPAAVDRLVHGEPVTSTPAERLEACRVLTGRGRSYTQIAALLRVTTHTVWRYKVQLRNQQRKAA